MPITIESLDTCMSLAQSWVQAEFPDEPLTEDSYHGKWARVLGMLLWSEKASIADADAEWPPSDSSSTAALDQAAQDFGLPDGSGVVGSYGRRVPIPATGGVGTITGVLGTAYLAGLTLLGPDGLTLFKLVANVTIPGAGPGTATASGSFIAVTPGSAGNLATGTTLSWVTPPAGNVGGVVLTSNDGHGLALTGGADAENNGGVLGRIRSRLQDSPKGGTANDWKTWAEATPGVAVSAYVYPRRLGTGTVSEVLTQAGSGTARAPSAGIVAAVVAYVETQRPVPVDGASGLAAAIKAPYMPTDAACAVRLRILPTTGHSFDWDSSAGALTVDTLTDATHIKLSTLLPASGKAAIDAGGTILVQFVSADGTFTLPIQLTCNQYVDGGGKSTLRFTGAYSSSIKVSDGVHAGGSAVSQVASDVLALVDGLGPSRVSGFADPDATSWDDTLRIDELVRVAMSSADALGIRLVRDLVATPTINGVTSNVQAADNGSNAPQLLYLKSVAVTP